MAQRINPRKRAPNSHIIDGTDITIKVNDCVLLRNENPNEDAYVARILDIYQKKVKIQWYYRPEETEQKRKIFHGKKEVLLSNHIDVQSTNTLQGKCIVHSLEDYIKLTCAGVDDYFCRFEYDAAKKCLIEAAVPVYCECNMPHNPDDFMIQCDGCELWFHPRCKNMNNKDAKQLVKFFCSKECDTIRSSPAEDPAQTTSSRPKREIKIPARLQDTLGSQVKESTTTCISPMFPYAMFQSFV